MDVPCMVIEFVLLAKVSSMRSLQRSNDAVSNILGIDDCLFGGRTEPFVNYYPPTDDKKIMYQDYTSLCPFVQNV